MPPKSYWARLPFSVRMTIGALAALLILGAVVVAFRTVVEDQPQAARRHPAEVTDRPDAVVTCSGEPAPVGRTAVGLVTTG